MFYQMAAALIYELIYELIFAIGIEVKANASINKYEQNVLE